MRHGRGVRSLRQTLQCRPGSGLSQRFGRSLHGRQAREQRAGIVVEPDYREPTGQSDSLCRRRLQQAKGDRVVGGKNGRRTGAFGQGEIGIQGLGPVTNDYISTDEDAEITGAEGPRDSQGQRRGENDEPAKGDSAGAHS